jgi:hypothetical protein
LGLNSFKNTWIGLQTLDRQLSHALNQLINRHIGIVIGNLVINWAQKFGHCRSRDTLAWLLVGIDLTIHSRNSENPWTSGPATWSRGRGPTTRSASRWRGGGSGNRLTLNTIITTTWRIKRHVFDNRLIKFSAIFVSCGLKLDQF